MTQIAGLLVLALLYVAPVILVWVVIYSAVLAALRRHDRDLLTR